MTYNVKPFSIPRDTAVGEAQALLAQVCGIAYGAGDEDLSTARELVGRLQDAMSAFRLNFEHLEMTASHFKLALETLHERVVDYETRLAREQEEREARGPETCRAPQALLQQMLQAHSEEEQPPATTRAEPPQSDVVLSAKGRRRMTMFLAAVTEQAAEEVACERAESHRLLLTGTGG